MTELSPITHIENFHPVNSEEPVINQESGNILNFQELSRKLRGRVLTAPKQSLTSEEFILFYRRNNTILKFKKTEDTSKKTEKPKRKRRPLANDPFTAYTGEYKPYDGPWIRKEKGPTGITSHEKCFICQKVLRVYVTEEQQQQMLAKAEPGSIEFTSTDTWCDVHWELELQKRPELRKYEQNQASA